MDKHLLEVVGTNQFLEMGLQVIQLSFDVQLGGSNPLLPVGVVRVYHLLNLLLKLVEVLVDHHLYLLLRYRQLVLQRRGSTCLRCT
jgi:hypothetical protein